MPEILTESFCERCGTRYTFESSAPKGRRLGRFKTISKGLRNFVMSDDTSLDEALAAARNDAEREATAHQLDAFHKTFNFCMSCRQYTCANCWNEPEGRCLTCAPHLGHEILPAPFPNLAPESILLDATNGAATNGHAAAIPEALSWPVSDLVRDEPAAEAVAEVAVEPEAEVAAEVVAAPEAEADVVAEVAVEPEAEVAVEPEAEAEAVAEPAVAVAAEAEAVADVVAEPMAEPLLAAAPDEPAPAADVEAPPAPIRPMTVHPTHDAVDDRAAAAAAQTAALLARFRPGQSIDAALDAFEAAQAADEAATEAPALPPVQAAPPLPTPAPEPAPVDVAPAATAEPAVAPESTVEPTALPVERVGQPAWRLIAPDATPRAADGHPADSAAGTAPAVREAPAQRPAAPQWPAVPQWPGQTSESLDNLAFLTAKRTPDDVWAASSRDVLAPAPPAGATTSGVQSCVNCGLSLSATARFCRRCGTRQGG
ncbi:MAG TPA: hypothetical protein VFR14_07815 [Candidatus Limnocylindrales bacterium]|nr:hypothetical protein [Candidatus Limnocylindrales bacterium]